MHRSWRPWRRCHYMFGEEAVLASPLKGTPIGWCVLLSSWTMLLRTTFLESARTFWLRKPNMSCRKGRNPAKFGQVLTNCFTWRVGATVAGATAGSMIARKSQVRPLLHVHLVVKSRTDLRMNVGPDIGDCLCILVTIDSHVCPHLGRPLTI